MKFSFGERTEILLKVLKISKSTCEALIKAIRVPELVGCPHVVIERVRGNHKSNVGRVGKEGAAKKKRGKSAYNQ
jgi:hypothetical protein